MKQMLQEKKYFKIIIIAVVLLIPVIYSFFYLKSYWDPYGNLKDVKVAIVNLDKGKRGAELIQNMQEAEGTLGFIETQSDKALEGLAKDEYYAVITIPDDFTSALESGGEEYKQKATITFTPNKRKNYLSYQIINSALKTTEIKLQGKVAGEVAETMANKLKEVPDSLDKIDGGVGQIKDGANSLSTGLNDLSTGANTLNEKYSEFDVGVKSATTGSEDLTSGIKEANDGIETLAKGSTDLDDGVEQINQALNSTDTSKITELTDGINTLNAGANSLQSGINAYVSGQNQLGQKEDQILQGIVAYYTAQVNAGLTPDTTLTTLAGGAQQILASGSRTTLTATGEQLKAGSASISAGTAQLKNSTNQIKAIGSGIETLKESLAEVQTGTGKLKNGISTLQTGTNKIQNGSSTLSAGLRELSKNSSLIKTALQQLSEGSQTAYNGSTQLSAGISTLKTSIQEGKTEATEGLKKLDGIKEFTENPVEIEEEPFGEVDSYGVAFTPLFLSIGLWVGALMLYVILYYDQKHRFGILDHEAGNKVVQNCIYLGIGAIEGLVTGIILKLLLGFSVASMGAFLFECILIGMTFTAIMQFLIRNLGDIGKFLALIILVLQLAASGGTFPVETIDKGFQAFTSWLPMTYTVRIFKDCLIPTNASLIGSNTVVVMSILAILFIANIVIEFIKDKRVNQTEDSK